MKCSECGLEGAVHFGFVVAKDEKSKRLVPMCKPCYGVYIERQKKDVEVVKELQEAKLQEAEKETKRKSFLDKYAQNLNILVQEGKVIPVIGREKEIDQAMEVLNRKWKNNPVFVGEPGVGKTAIAEGIASRIVKGNVPKKMKDRVVYSLDITSILAGTSYRGQFEDRMKKVMKDVAKRGNIILFIDEIHMIVGAGSASGSSDAANILKPELARGELVVMGATTWNEYRVHIEKDAALERRFEPIVVNEPTKEATLAILKGIRPVMETHHGVRYDDDVLKQCVELTDRYIQNRHFPDKAISLMDIAGAKVSLRKKHEGKGAFLKDLEERSRKKGNTVHAYEFQELSRVAIEEEEMMQEVTRHNLLEAMEQKTGIPLMSLNETEKERLIRLEATLNERIIGQEVAVKQVADAIKRSRVGLTPPHRPQASFLFAGPTGVGKTELANVLTHELLGSREALIRIDMSEYMEKHSVSKLIGAPPGYVGHEQAGFLTEKVRKQPYAVLLFDEIEKAHPDVQNIFLQLLDDGHLTDGKGRKVDFRQTIIICTTNAGQEGVTGGVGFGDVKGGASSLKGRLKGAFRPEFLNRFDGLIEFDPLASDALEKIVAGMITELGERLAKRGTTLTVSRGVIAHLAKTGYDPEFGARPLRRAIQEQLETMMADMLVEDPELTHVTVDMMDGEVVFLL